MITAARKTVHEFVPSQITITLPGSGRFDPSRPMHDKIKRAVSRAAKRFFSPGRAGSSGGHGGGIRGSAVPGNASIWERLARLYLDENYIAFLNKAAGRTDHEFIRWMPHPAWYKPFAGAGILYKTGRLAAAFDPDNPGAERKINYTSRGFSINITVPYAEEHNTGARVIYTGPGPRHGDEIKLRRRPLFIENLSETGKQLAANQVISGLIREIQTEIRKVIS